MASTPIIANSSNVHIENSNLTNISGNRFQIENNRVKTVKNYYGNASLFDLLKDHIAFSAVFNSSERESEQASACQEGTRTQILQRISEWAIAETSNQPICWLEGPAGAGKSSIAQTIAQQYSDQGRLAFSFFFSRGKLDRSDTRKFVPTCAYQLARSLPAIEAPLRDIVKDQSILSQTLGNQIEKLIIEPARDIPMDPMVVVIDGLDECGDGQIRNLIELLSNIKSGQFRFLFTSRPEAHLVRVFRSRSFAVKTLSLSLRDFDAREDVLKYLRLELSKILEHRLNNVQEVPKPWPSEEDLQTLVEKSEKLFIYVSTLVKFVGEERALPHRRLQLAIQLDNGLDPMYDQILSEAADVPYFNLVLGTIVYLLGPLSVNNLAGIIQLAPSDVQLALGGCHSILRVPDPAESGYEEETICPYHASLKDFLTNPERSGSHACSYLEHHSFIAASCIKIISQGYDEDGFTPGYVYACQHWMEHLSLVLTKGGSIRQIESVFHTKLLRFMKNICVKWFQQWMYGLEMYNTFSHVVKQCMSLYDKMPGISLELFRIVRHLKKINLKLKVSNQKLKPKHRTHCF